MKKPTSCSLLSASRVTTLVARYAISFFNTSLLPLQNPLFMCPVTKLADYIALLHHSVSSTKQHIESLKEVLSSATGYFHRLITHIVSIFNRLLFPASASGRI